ncbi:MAG: TRAP transporter fused permease subunit [Pseudorhodoplanes sp.]|nr:TRAP transporter fused permease subunit [Pseudorhodoplanes sp.]GIK79886.1 MAG: ATP-binding protein [Alphaproteobacteria bacterium]
MTGKALDTIMAVLKAALITIVVASILNIPGRLNIPLFTEQVLVAVLGLALALTFLMFPLGARITGEEATAAKMLGDKDETRVGAIDLVLAAAALISCFYVAIRYPQLIVELVTRPWYGVLVASVIVLLVFEASRRVTGMALVLIVLALCAHALLGWMLPDTFASRPVSLSRLMVYLGIDTNALLGSTLQIAIVVVIPFIIMGSVLTRCGGSDFFAELAAALMGQFRGGAGKIAVFGSALFGMISGSAVANVASVGTITIPLMKRSGFPPHTSAAIEAVGSTGGQIAPPVMGAAAFLMAEYLQVPYASVMVAAIIPAFLFYAALFMQVDLEAAKHGIVGMPREARPPLWRVLRGGWHFTVPFAVLVYALLGWNMEAEYAALLATAVLIVLAMTVKHKGRRVTPREVLAAVIGAGGSVVDIIAITAIAGILIGAMAITGVAFSLTQQLLSLSGGDLVTLLIITAIASFFLGLPLPTVGVYIVLATLAAPALIQSGISPMQAHMFVLFNGILGMVTPPVALAAFAAATIARSDQWRTGWTATRMSWCAYFIPFLFVFSPALLMQGSALEIIIAFANALLGIFMGTIAVVGYLKAPIAVPWRIAYGVIAALVLWPGEASPAGIPLGLLGIALAVVAIAYEILRGAPAAQTLTPRG